MKQNGSRFRLHAGTASILLVFVTLCLVSFAVLTLVNANADMRLSRRIAERTAAYYEAVSAAERFIAETDQTGISGTETVEKTFPINDTQLLRVVLAPSSAQEETEASAPADRLPDRNLYGGNPLHCKVICFRVETDETIYEFEETLLNLPH